MPRSDTSNASDFGPLTLSQLAHLAGMSQQRLAGHVKNGNLPSGPLPLAEWLPDLIAAEARRLSTGDIDETDRRYSKARADRMEAAARRGKLEADRAAGLLVEKSAVVAVFGNRIRVAQTRILGVPTRIAPRLEGRTAAEMHGIMMTALREALTDLSRGAADGSGAVTPAAPASPGGESAAEHTDAVR